MAISPSFPPDLFASLSLSSSSFSPSLPFLSIQNKTHSSSHRNLKHESFCSNQTIDFETEVAQKIQVKKKRKLRPSFYEQVRERWSLKNQSQRTQFPWQQQKIEEEEEEEEEKEAETEEEEGEAEVVTQSLNSVEEGEEKEVNFELGNKISAPWVYNEISETPKRVVNRNDSGNKISEDYVTHFGLVEEKLKNEFERVSFDSGKNDNVGNSVVVGSRDGDLGAVLPWAISSNRESVNGHKWKRNKTEVAEKSIPEIELKRLRNVGLRMQMRIKVGAAGITQALVECIREKWKVGEVVKLKFEGPPALNMRRTHDVIEGISQF